MLSNFINPMQLSILRDTDNEEKDFFIAVTNNLTNIIDKMPVTYEQDGLGNKAVAHLHYFTGNCDAYITEKDICSEQLQAFGYINIGNGYEAGYISLVELLANGFELDFHFTPKQIQNLI